MVDPLRIELRIQVCKTCSLPLTYRPMEIIKNCLNCSSVFYTEQKYIDRGHGKYCSRSCAAKHTNSLRPEKPHNCKCHVCLITFYRNDSKKKVSKSGIHFCSRLCKEKAQTLDYGLKEIQPSHYGSITKTDDSKHYRKVAFKVYEKVCNRCGYSDHPEILQVHHIDRNRMNDSISNLEVLCPNCHELEHIKNNG
jgi:hypothetical protein